MPDEHLYSDRDSIPIPTYEESTSSRPLSSFQRLGASEISDDAERQGLLGERDPRWPASDRDQAQYQAPTAESYRSSVESDVHLSKVTSPIDSEDEGGLRREIEQMEEGDPEAASQQQSHPGIRQQFSKRFSNLTQSLSSLSLPSFRVPFASLSLISERLPQIPDIYKPGWGVLAKLFGLMVVIGAIYSLVVIEVFPMRGPGRGQHYDSSTVMTYVQNHVDSNRIKGFLAHITSFDHVAGSEGNYVLGKWVEEIFKSANIDAVETIDYQVYLNYPKPGGRRVAIVHPPELAWEAKLEEEQVEREGIDSATAQQQTMNWHGHSKSGNVTGPLVYANYGSQDDFAKLKDIGTNLTGAIVLVRYYGTQGDRALKVKAAELAGAAGCLIYSDPADDGFVKGQPWPEGPWRTNDSVQRGAVSLMSWVVGDVLTPGWASTSEAPRLSPEQSAGLVKIPSLPLAWRDAQPLLQALKGHGRKVPNEWIGGVPDVEEWWTGSPQNSPLVNLRNEQDEVKKQPIYNILGTFTGLESPEKAVYVGNHRDSWCFGAADPGSGTAVMLEVVTILGQMRRLGWRPLRTIHFASWDAEEYNMIGSTEYVEDERNLGRIREHGVGYLNVDVGVIGNRFRAAASPIFKKALLRVLDRVSDPFANASLRQLWDDEQKTLEGLGAGSDYVAFQDIAGCSSIDFGFTASDPDAFPYHSCYETFEWMEKFGDPGFYYHNLLAQVLALLIIEIADSMLLPYDLSAYAAAVQGYASNLEEYVKTRGAIDGDRQSFDVGPLREASEQFAKDAEDFHKWDAQYNEGVERMGGFESKVMGIRRVSHNTRMSNFETHLLDLPEGPDGADDGEVHGIPGRTQFKHIIFGPQLWSGYDEPYFPAIRDAVDAGNWTAAQVQLEKAARILKKASGKLVHN